MGVEGGNHRNLIKQEEGFRGLLLVRLELAMKHSPGGGHTAPPLRVPVGPLPNPQQWVLFPTGLSLVRNVGTQWMKQSLPSLSHLDLLDFVLCWRLASGLLGMTQGLYC